MSKIGRNQPCPCGSGKKYKRCHGAIERLDAMSAMARQVPLKLAQKQAEETRREQLQGVGKPIISAEWKGYRLVAVRNRLHYSKNWKTFHDFLTDYLKMVMGKEWWLGEVAKPESEHHPILRWAKLMYDYQVAVAPSEPGKIRAAPMNGASAAYLNLAYDLYALDHSIEVQDLLIKRLKNAVSFAGARYEVSVAAKLLRAGFELEFEDETDGSTTHVEFTAKHKRTGRAFSVEAKERDAKRLRVNRLLFRALSKHAEHRRLVFVDINEPDSTKGEFPPKFLLYAEERLRAYERDPVGSLLPEAYVVVTNTPWHYTLEGREFRCSALVHGFKIPELQHGVGFASIREALRAREAHAEMHDLMRSLEEHSLVPSTFDGEIPEFAFGATPRRFTVGERCTVAGSDGSTIQGRLESGIVMETTGEAMCVLKLDDGKTVICSSKLTPLELQAWQAHPSTFFGVMDRNVRRKQPETPLDWYDFLFESFEKTSKEILLRHLKGAPDIERLQTLQQPELASLYCERLAMVMFSQASPTQRG